jgi:hypothetical protein
MDESEVGEVKERIKQEKEVNTPLSSLFLSLLPCFLTSSNFHLSLL